MQKEREEEEEEEEGKKQKQRKSLFKYYTSTIFCWYQSYYIKSSIFLEKILLFLIKSYR